MRNIKYIGPKSEETAFKDKTGFTWTPEAVHTILDDDLAREMARYTDVFQDLGDVGLEPESNPVAPIRAQLEALNGGGITAMVKLTQAEYDALTPVDTTLYLIVE
jgi:hypothetical protein